MGTTKSMFDEDALETMVSNLKEWPNSFWDDGEKEMSVSPFITFYFLYDTSRWIETSLLMVDIHEEFERITGNQYKTATHPISERPHSYGSKKIPDLREFARKTKRGQSFMFNVSSETNHGSSPATAGYFWKKRDYMNDDHDPANKVYSSIQLYYRWEWFRDNRGAWQDFVLNSIEKLRPEVVYSGLSMANPLEFGSRAPVTVWERALAPHFFGLDIDDPWSMSMLGDGIRPPTWGFLLSDTRSAKLALSREQVKDRLCDPNIKLTEVTNGLWIELGKEPSLYPVEEGCPRLPALLNKLLRPIRNDHIELVGFPQWDDDPNQRFSREDSKRWLQRFDDDSDWPSDDLRRPKSPESGDFRSPVQEYELRAKSGEPCPAPGRWQSVDAFQEVRCFEKGELLKHINSAYGLTVWRFLGQDPSC
jgi:hypothetical protein